MLSSEALRARWQDIKDSIHALHPTATLLAVSKGQSIEAIRTLYTLGQRDFGENYAQELLIKSRALLDLKDLRWHVTGPLQRNKVSALAPYIHTLQTLASLPLAEKLSSTMTRPLCIWVQVNTSLEPHKQGILPENLPDFLQSLQGLPQLKLMGLMTLPHVEDTQGEGFQTLKRLRDKYLPELGLSMGMSHDYPLALKHKATLVRIGSALFGPRQSALKP